MFEGDNYFYNNEIEVCEETFNVALYERVSDADERKNEYDVESESITNQREFLTRYVLNKGWNIIDEYVDDGYTGTNFYRPAFQKMIRDIKQGIINLVIVKDYSRFGRNYSKAGYYLDEFFPSHNVRFIAINDGIDTFKKNNNNNELSGFKGVMNDMYSADISKKIRTSFNSKRRGGQFIGAFAPYGYKKDPNNKNKLIIDDEAAKVVKRIFEMRVNGIANEKIMRILNDEKISCPAKYKAESGLNYKNVNVIYYVWRSETIKDILRNPTYIGNIAQKKSERISYKVRKHKKIPRDKWLIVENTHEPIIDKETFYKVQKLLDEKAYGITEFKTEHLLSGILYCGDCGMPITFRRDGKKKNKDFITLCSNYSRFHNCTRHAVLLDNVDKLVINDLQNIANMAIKNKNEFMNKINKPNMKEEKNINKNIIEKKQRRLAEIIKLRRCLYEDWKRKIITKEDFDSMYLEYNKEKEKISNDILKLQKEIKEEKKKDQVADYINLLENIVNFNIVPKNIIIELIDKVEIFQDKTVRIHYKFSKVS